MIENCDPKPTKRKKLLRDNDIAFGAACLVSAIVLPFIILILKAYIQ